MVMNVDLQVTFGIIMALFLVPFLILLLLYYRKSREKNFLKDERITALNWKSSVYGAAAGIAYLGLVFIALTLASTTLDTGLLSPIFISFLEFFMLVKFAYLVYKIYTVE